ncbi:MAG TPA: AraC family transcriptional regulator [Anaeromyxobacteraceae bacterium]|nr:AraC family transcriptional regulator [Anaeromyxobacteraceae bacterium]
MWPREGTVLTVSSRALVEACGRLGIDTETLLRAAGIQRRTLEDPDARLRNREAGALWAKAYELSGDPVLSLHVAEACPLGAYKVIDYMASSARTVGEAFRYAARYFKLINTAVSLPIDESGDPVTFDVEGEGGPPGVSRAYAEYCLAVFVLHMRAGTGVPIGLRRVTFTHRLPTDVSEHERVFGCPVHFEAEHNRLYSGRSGWETPTTGAHSGVLGVLREHADLLLSRLPRGPDLIERTRRAIGERLRGGVPSLEGVARELGLSERSLQRRLSELGYTYNAVADEVREATARLYLEQPDIALAEIGYLLGFADQSTFTHAFKRWTGRTPRRARADAMGAKRAGPRA